MNPQALDEARDLWHQAEMAQKARVEAALASRDLEIDGLTIEVLRARLKLAERVVALARTVRLTDQMMCGLDRAIEAYDALAGASVEVDLFAAEGL